MQKTKNIVLKIFLNHAQYELLIQNENFEILHETKASQLSYPTVKRESYKNNKILKI